MSIRSLLVSVAILTCSCGDLIPSQSSCDFRPKTESCVDLLTNRNSQLKSTLQGLCAGTYSDSLCNHTGALGGCECDGCENGKAVTWMFPDPANAITTTDDLKKACNGEPFVSP